jgi:hypothetical protein
MKKKAVLLILILSIFFKTNAQEIIVSLNVDPRPNPQISEWVDRTELALLTIVNTSQNLEDLEYKIQTKIYKDDVLVVETKTSQMPIMLLPFGSDTFLADEIIPYNALRFYGNIEKTVIQTGLLPAGIYSFCVSLIDLKGNFLTRQESFCKPMIITDYQLPELIYPIENTIISTQSLPSTIFIWSPLAPMPPGDEGVKYIIAISKVRNKQSPARAFDVNFPLVEEEIMAGTQFNWPTDIDIPDEDTQYVWSIKPVTFNDNPYKSGKNSFVKIGTFTVTNQNRGQTDGADDSQNDANTIVTLGQDDTQNGNTFLDKQKGINCNMSKNQFIAPLSFTAGYQYWDVDDAALTINHMDTMATNYMADIGITDPENYYAMVEIDWGYNIEVNLVRGTESFNYSEDYLMGNREIPSEICFKLTIKKSDSREIICEKSVCIPFPDHIKEHLKANWPPEYINLTPDCENFDEEVIRELIVFLPQAETEPGVIQITNFQGMNLTYMTQVLGGMDPLQFEMMMTSVDWGGVHNGLQYDYMASLIDHDYAKHAPVNLQNLTEICFTFEIKSLVTGEIVCTHTVCKDLPQWLIDSINENDDEANGKTEGEDPYCECSNEAEIDVSFLPMMLQTSLTGNSVVEVHGLLALQNMIRACMTDVPEAAGNPAYDFPNWQFQTQIGFDATHIPVFDAFTAGGDYGSHTYDTHHLAMPCEITDQLQIEVKVVNEELGFSCTMVFYKDIPEHILNDIYGEKEECNCEENEIPEPTVHIAQADAEIDPLKMQLVNYETYKSYVLGCASNPEDFVINAAIDWGDATLLSYSASPGTEHTYTSIEDMPESVELLFELKPLVITDEKQTCVINYSVPISEEFKETLETSMDCDCTDLALEEPELNIFQTEPEDNPRNLTFAGVIAYRDYLLACNDDYSLETQSMVVTLNWGEEHPEESIVGGGPFIHEYAIDHEIPEEICATFTIAALFPGEGEEDVSCVTVKCLSVSPELLALNTGAVGEGELALGESIFAGEHVADQGEFEIITTTLEGDAPGPYSGTGTVYIDWIKSDMTVEFTDITIDEDNNLVSGFIRAQIHDTAPVYPIAWLIGMGGGITFNHEHAEDIIDWIELNSDQEIDFDPATGAVMPVKVPLGLNFPSGDQLAITEMVFRADKSEFNLVAAKTTPPSWGPIQLVGFNALNIAFHPDSPEFPPERMELLEDITIGNINGKITFTFKAPTIDNPGCYIEWDELGFSAYGVELDANFTREWLIPLPDDGTSKSRANLVATGSAWGDLVLIGNLDESVISSSIPDPDSGLPTDSGAHDFIILADTISYDWSDLANAPAIEFPTIYAGETTNLFRGFHMEELTVKFSPNKMNTPEGDPIEISINDMIIDDTGITLEAEIENLVVFGDAEVGDMAASIDRIYLKILSSSFVEAGVEGRIAIPVSDGNSMDDSLAYAALFNVPIDPAANKNFQITLTPDQPINADLLKGTMTLDDTSNLSGYFDKDKKTFTMELNGDFTWEDAEIGPVKEINLEIGFEGVGFDYDSSLASNKLTFDAGAWSFASPQKKMANFPVTIDNIEYNSMTATGNQLLHGKLNFDVIFNLSKKIGGMTTLGAEVAINDESGTGGKKFVPEFIGGVIDSIAIQADMAAVKIKGAIGFRNDDPVFGDGFIGTLSAEFKGPGIKVGALAEFGNTTYLHGSRYRYWRVEAEATFPAPGITFLPGMAFRGFGGGAFKNMEATLAGSTYTFTPKFSSLGFRAQAVMATTPKEETFNADVGLLGTFSGAGGMTYIGFTGDFYVGAGFATRNKAKVDGTLTVDYDFPQKHFNLSASVNVNAPPITTPSPMSLVLDINGKTNDWYFKFGEPANLNTVNVFGISLYEYLMFGNDIPYPGGFTNTFKTNYYNALGVYPSAGGAATGGIGSNTASGKGFALGIGFMFDKSGEKQLTDYYNDNKKHVLTYSLSAGAELHLSYMEYLGSCGGYTPVGINGWRAKGSLGMYGMAAAGVKKYKINGDVKWNADVASIAAGAWITGEFPNPYYVAGAIDGSITIFDLVSFSFHKNFEKGTSCGNGGAGTGVPVTQGDAAAEQENALIQYVHPDTAFNFPTDEPIAVKYGLNPDEIFDVSEQQVNGTVEMRTFKMIVSKTLQIKNDGTGAWEAVSLTTDENNLGEFLYTKTTALVLGTAPEVFAPMIAPGGAGIGVAAPAPMGTYAAPLGFIPLAPPAPGVMADPGGLMMYPDPGPGDGYDDLPPEPEPVINSLTANKDYTFTVTATLKEWNGSSWVIALKNDLSPVNQTIVKNFRTGAPVLIADVVAPTY